MRVVGLGHVLTALAFRGEAKERFRVLELSLTRNFGILTLQGCSDTGTLESIFLSRYKLPLIQGLGES